MIFSTSRKFVYVHVYKCSGTSVETALSKVLGYNDIPSGSTTRGACEQKFFRARIGLHKHSSALEIRDFVGRDVWKSFYTFAFVRHPVSRLQSLFRYSRKLAKNANASEKERAAMREGKFPDRPPFTWHFVQTAVISEGFEDFILNSLRRKDRASRPQVEFICPAWCAEFIANGIWHQGQPLT